MTTKKKEWRAGKSGPRGGGRGTGRSNKRKIDKTRGGEDVAVNSTELGLSPGIIRVMKKT